MNRIAAAAVRWSGLTVSMPRPARHHDVLRGLHMATGAMVRGEDQGFTTDNGEFVDRYMAADIAREANQIIKKHGPEDQLFSEDVW